MDMYGYTHHVVEADTHHFTWAGGEYVEIAQLDNPGYAYDVINVWDYEKGGPSIPFTLAALTRRVERWFKDQAEAEADA